MNDHQHLKIAFSVELNTCTQRVVLEHVLGKDELTPRSHKKQILSLCATTSKLGLKKPLRAAGKTTQLYNLVLSNLYSHEPHHHEWTVNYVAFKGSLLRGIRVCKSRSIPCKSCTWKHSNFKPQGIILKGSNCASDTTVLLFRASPSFRQKTLWTFLSTVLLFPKKRNTVFYKSSECHFWI